MLLGLRLGSKDTALVLRRSGWISVEGHNIRKSDRLLSLLIYKPILTEKSHLQLQSDINSISHWADNNLMTFNEAKCKCMLLTNKIHIVFPTITLNDHPLEVVHQIKYSGIVFSKSLLVATHQTICKKAWRIIGILYLHNG